jgi:hypothetical protein
MRLEAEQVCQALERSIQLKVKVRLPKELEANFAETLERVEDGLSPIPASRNGLAMDRDLQRRAISERTRLKRLSKRCFRDHGSGAGDAKLTIGLRISEFETNAMRHAADGSTSLFKISLSPRSW